MTDMNMGPIPCPGAAQSTPQSSDMHSMCWVTPQVRLALHLLAQMLKSYSQRRPSFNARQAGDL